MLDGERVVELELEARVRRNSHAVACPAARRYASRATDRGADCRTRGPGDDCSGCGAK